MTELKYFLSFYTIYIYICFKPPLLSDSDFGSKLNNRGNMFLSHILRVQYTIGIYTLHIFKTFPICSESTFVIIYV